MGADESKGYVVEPEKQVPIAYDVDVVVVGAGLPGCLQRSLRGSRGQRPS